jgi:hypothetical protein
MYNVLRKENETGDCNAVEMTEYSQKNCGGGLDDPLLQSPASH